MGGKDSYSLTTFGHLTRALYKKFIMKRIVLFILATVCLSGCKKNDDKAPMEIAIQNEPPLSFDLLDVPDDATNVKIAPMLSWESAKNPKGSAITYDLYLGTDITLTTIYQTDIRTTAHQVNQELRLLTDYYWKVVATDSDGRRSQSTIHKFSTRNLNFPETPTAVAGFAPRSGHATAVFNEKIWVIGGEIGPLDFTNDVWCSGNGEEWVQATENAGFSARSRHTSIVFDDKLWVIGGFEDLAFKNDVWYSDNGTDWVKATENAEFSPRLGHKSFVFDDKIWVIGGGAIWTVFNDVWYSSDGVNWTEATQSPPFLERASHATFVFDNKMWVAGGVQGIFLNDAWSSKNGIAWTQINTVLPFPKRAMASATVYDNKIWLIGGSNDTGQMNDAWYSKDGTNWSIAGSSHPIFERNGHSTEIFKNQIWIIGGANEEGYLNDVWALD